MTDRPRTLRLVWGDLGLPLLGAALLVFLFVRGNEYAAGTRNDMGRVFGVLMGVLFFGLPVLLAALIGQLTWLVVSWSRRTRTARIIGTASVLTPALVLVIMFWPKKGADQYLKGFVVWAQQNANYTILDGHRAALVQAATTQPHAQGNPVMVPDNLWPPAIVSLQPSYVTVYPDDSIDFVWGGGFGHWGLYLHGNGPPQSNYVSGALVLPVQQGLDAWSSP